MRIALARSRLAIRSSMAQVLRSVTNENILASNQDPPSKIQRINAAEPPLRVKKLSEHATIPKRGSEKAAGYDLSRYVKILRNFENLRCSDAVFCPMVITVRTSTPFLPMARSASRLIYLSPSPPVPTDVLPQGPGWLPSILLTLALVSSMRTTEGTSWSFSSTTRTSTSRVRCLHAFNALHWPSFSTNGYLRH